MGRLFAILAAALAALRLSPTRLFDSRVQVSHRREKPFPSRCTLVFSGVYS
ncbi:hypothetical protein NCPPB3778_57 [Rathayibacter phage NCPPB3778]|nr:hypothetical protein NCPPB3778_57 [Rathayibacter phage NCPPB3778]